MVVGRMRCTDNVDRAAYKGPMRDDYVMGAHHYEMAAAAWRDCNNAALWPETGESVEEYRRKMANETLMWLEKSANSEGYVLDGRFGLRVQAGIDSVKWLKAKKRWE